MGIPAWIWFVIAAVALVAGLALLAADRSREGSRNRERMRWAELRGWDFAEEDEHLPRQWSGGAVGYFGAEAAVNVVTGSTFTSDGRRPVFVFDIESEGQIPAVVVAVRCNRVHPVLLEMWLASVPFQRDEMPELLGPIGQRYAFADDVAGARVMITQELVDAADALGGDVGVAWLENEWVLASAAPNAGPSRLERLLRDLGEIADIVDPFEEEEFADSGRHYQDSGRPDERQFDGLDEDELEVPAPVATASRREDAEPADPEPGYAEPGYAEDNPPAKPSQN